MAESEDVNPEAWVDLYGDALFRYAQLRIKDSAVAEELVQETFLAAVRNKDRFKGRSSEKTWLYSILKHKLIDFYRSSGKAPKKADFDHIAYNQDDLFDQNGEWRIKPQSWPDNPEKAYEYKEFLNFFYQCLAQVPRRLADVFAYREIDGLKTKEICKILDISPTNCGVMLYRARMQLRRCLDATWLNSSSKGKM